MRLRNGKRTDQERLLCPTHSIMIKMRTLLDDYKIANSIDEKINSIVNIYTHILWNIDDILIAAKTNELWRSIVKSIQKNVPVLMSDVMKMIRSNTQRKENDALFNCMDILIKVNEKII